MAEYRLKEANSGRKLGDSRHDSKIHSTCTNLWNFEIATKNLQPYILHIV